MRKGSNFIVIVLLIVVAFFGGFYFGMRGFVVELKKNPPNITILNKEPSDQTVDFANFWLVWDALNRNHVDRPLDSKKLLYGAISGMVNAVGDEYTSFFNPEQNVIAKSSLNGVYEGIGAELGFKDKQLIIVSPLEGSPAQAVGVLPGDKILEIEGESTLGISLPDAVSKIRGKAGTVSTLLLQRSDKEPVEFKITRGKIVSESVTWKDLGDGVGYLRLARFGDNTTSQWSESVAQMKTEMPNLRGVVVDVRGNPGGYLEAAIYIASEFLRAGQMVMYQEHADGTRTDFRVTRLGQLVNVPVVVVLDNGSASASEIVAAALKDSDNAKLIGVTSFGKGTIQSSEEFKDGSSLHVTIAKWLTPNKVWIHKVGLTPDVVVERAEEDLGEGVDPQLDTAKQVLLGDL